MDVSNGVLAPAALSSGDVALTRRLSGKSSGSSPSSNALGFLGSCVACLVTWADRWFERLTSGEGVDGVWTDLGCDGIGGCGVVCFVAFSSDFISFDVVLDAGLAFLFASSCLPSERQV